ncbi:MAG: hypothetical protein WDM81_14140 [Rhizomicrobium sp.]
MIVQTVNVTLSDFIGKLAETRDRMKTIARDLQIAFPDKSIRHNIDFYVQGETSIIEIFLELSSGAGKYFCWWINLEPSEFWRIETSLQQNEGEGETTLSHNEYIYESAEEIFFRISTVLDLIQKFPIQYPLLRG